MTAKITKIKIDGLRTLSNFELELGKLTVLIGENGCGKSSVVEAFELLRRMTNHPCLSEFNEIHGGDRNLLRFLGGLLQLRVEFSKDDVHGYYDVALNGRGISSEAISNSELHDSVWLTQIILRSADNARKLLVSADNLSQSNGDSHNEIGNGRVIAELGQLPPQHTILSMRGHGAMTPILQDVTKTIEAIDVHLPFAAGPQWAARSIGARAPLREAVTLMPAFRLERFGVNLPNAYHSLRNEQSHEDWEYTMELVRAGIGQWVESVNTLAGAGGGSIALSLKRYNVDTQISAAALSDGQLAYLAFVALARLPTERSILVFDEVDLHLHPSMMSHVMGLLKQISEKCPVLITTHSRRLLDELDDPADSVRVMELEPTELKTVVSRLDKEVLKDWLEDYNGVGDVFDSGYPEALLMQRPKME